MRIFRWGWRESEDNDTIHWWLLDEPAVPLCGEDLRPYTGWPRGEGGDICGKCKRRLEALGEIVARG